MKYAVYVIRHIATGMVVYVGKTGEFEKRKYKHLNLLTNTKDWIAKIGTSNILIDKVAEFENEDEALKYEDELICRYGTIENGYNKIRSGLITTNTDYKKEYTKEYQQREIFKESHQKRQASYFADHHNNEDFKQRNRKRMKLYRIRKKAEKMAS